MIYIGITGKTGKYRSITAWLLGGLMESMMNPTHTEMDHRRIFEEMIMNLKENGMSIIGSSNKVVLESFGKYIVDQMILFVGGAFNLNLDSYSDLKKYKINLDNFEVSIYDSLSPNEISLKDFTVRFGESLMKTFGEDVWVKSVNSWVGMRDEESEVVIYTDVKTDCELTHVQQLSGLILRVVSLEDEWVDEYNKITHPYFGHTIKVPFVLNDIHFDEKYFNQLKDLAYYLIK